MTRVVIDESLCVGNGRCYTVSADLFEDDERGYGQVRGAGALSGDLVEAAARAVQACPEGAISIVEDPE
jgi:ferredoxin